MSLIMTDTLHILNDLDSVTVHAEKCEFKKDAILGLSKIHKQIQAKYLYDEHGCELFNKISRHPDFYLTRCELEILNSCKKHLAKLLNSKSFNLIELGPGDGTKTQILIEQFIRDSLKFTYTPIDLSAYYLKKIVSHLNNKFPQLQITAFKADYFNGLKLINANSEQRKLILFLGSNVGHLDPVYTEEFFKILKELLHSDDYVLIGFDLRKNIDMLMRAYNNSEGLTRDFNLNLLRRINHELDANFNLDKFHHYVTYNANIGAMENFLISSEEQKIYIESYDRFIKFENIEPIHVGYSYKYLLSQIELLARTSGFEIIQNFTDANHFYVNTLWKVH